MQEVYFDIGMLVLSFVFLTVIPIIWILIWSRNRRTPFRYNPFDDSSGRSVVFTGLTVVWVVVFGLVSILNGINLLGQVVYKLVIGL